MGLRFGDPRDLAGSGWGVIFAADDPHADPVREALRPLLEHRRSQAASHREHYYREFFAGRGYQAGDTKRRFLSRHGVGPGSADPDRMPYYLLLIGNPDVIPYDFQIQLDMQYGVGRLYFETIEDYARYARNVVEIETLGMDLPRLVTFFSPQHAGDPVTQFLCKDFVKPLASFVSRRFDWQTQQILGYEATKERLIGILSGQEPTGLLFTAGHGMVFSSDHPLLRSSQGALLCSDWPGQPNWEGRPIPSDCYLSATDLAGALQRNKGLLSFHYSAYSMGWPAWDNWQGRASFKPHLAQLPQELLKSGSLAVIGSTSSILVRDWPGFSGHFQMMEDIMDRLLSGHPVGSALESTGVRYADCSNDLLTFLEEEKRGTGMDESVLADLWISASEARHWTVLGDPAVRVTAGQL